MTAREDDRALRYLLEEMAPAERDAFEEEYLLDDAVYEEVRAAEDDLIDAYCDGALPPARRAAFERRYLATAAGRDEVELTRTLMRYAAGRAPASAPAPAATRPHRGYAWVAAAAGLAAVALLAGLFRVSSDLRRVKQERDTLRASAGEQQRRLDQHDTQTAALARELEEARARAGAAQELLGQGAGAAARAVSLALSGGLRREASTLPRLSLTPEVSLVRLRLQLPAAASGTYRASLQTPEGREIWARDGLPAAIENGRPTVVFPVPAAALSGGQYIVTLASPPSSRRDLTDAEYAFAVNRRP